MSDKISLNTVRDMRLVAHQVKLGFAKSNLASLNSKLDCHSYHNKSQPVNYIITRYACVFQLVEIKNSIHVT